MSAELEVKTHVRMFSHQFHEAVKSGKKRQTIRRSPKRGIMAGDTISLRGWSGNAYRSKQVILRYAEVKSVRVVEIFGDSMHIGKTRLTQLQREEVAIDDGFKCFNDMTAWIRNNYELPFEGVMISW